MKLLQKLIWPAVILMGALIGVDSYQRYQDQIERLLAIEQLVSVVEERAAQRYTPAQLKAVPESVAVEMLTLQEKMMNQDRQMLEGFRKQLARMWWAKSRVQQLIERIDALDKKLQDALNSGKGSPAKA